MGVLRKIKKATDQEEHGQWCCSKMLQHCASIFWNLWKVKWQFIQSKKSQNKRNQCITQHKIWMLETQAEMSDVNT
jgi:hypothetical protein